MLYKTSETQYGAIHVKFNELMAEASKMRYPAGAKPSASVIWDMATRLVIAENS